MAIRADPLRMVYSLLVSVDLRKGRKEILACAAVSKFWREAADSFLCPLLHDAIKRKRPVQCLLYRTITIPVPKIMRRMLLMPFLKDVALYLEAKDVFVCRRVCKGWSGVLSNLVMYSIVTHEFRILSGKISRRGSANDASVKVEILQNRKLSLQYMRAELNARFLPLNIPLLKPPAFPE